MNFTLGKRRVKAPIGKLFVLVMLVILLVPTLPLHFVKWAIDGDGFLRKDRSGRWTYAPGWLATNASLAALIALLLVVFV